MEFTDQLGNTIYLQQPPQRIVSLVPSQSEYIWYLGLQNQLAGITKFCVHPEQMFRSVERVGGTKQIDMAKIRKLNPDLIIGNKEENVKEQIEELSREFNVWMSDVNTFEGAFEMMLSVGKMCERQEDASKIVEQLRADLPSIKGVFNGLTVAYFIWNQPWMVAAGNTFIHHVLQYAGLNVVPLSAQRYPQLTEAELMNLAPQLCFLSSEPFPFAEKHAEELRQLLPHSKIIFTDGEMLSWYGSRLLYLPDYLMSLKRLVNESL